MEKLDAFWEAVTRSQRSRQSDLGARRKKNRSLLASRWICPSDGHVNLRSLARPGRIEVWGSEEGEQKCWFRRSFIPPQEPRDSAACTARRPFSIVAQEVQDSAALLILLRRRPWKDTKNGHCCMAQ